jgi:hypothetical protein
VIAFNVRSTLNLGVIAFPVTLGFSLCLSGSCAGNITSSFNISTSYKGIPITIPNVALGRDWGFTATTSASFSGSDSVGNHWGGLKGDFSGGVTVGVSSTPSVTVDSYVSVQAYYGAGGSWHGLGTVGTDLDLSGSSVRFCYSKHLSGVGTLKICIP